MYNALITNFKQIDGLVRERHNTIANVLELHLSCTSPSKLWWREIRRSSTCQFLYYQQVCFLTGIAPMLSAGVVIWQPKAWSSNPLDCSEDPGIVNRPLWLTLNVRGPSYLGISVWLGQYHRCWCPGSLCRQDTSSHDIDYVEWVGPCLIWGRISTTCVISMWRNDMKCKYLFYVPSEKFSM